MNTPRSEFIDTYSDDMSFLNNLRKSVLGNPFESHIPFIVDSSIARIYAVMMIGNVESAIIEEFTRSGSPHLNTYLNGRRTSNFEKITALKNYLHEVYTSGGVDTEVISDYLAIKYVRNGIIHSSRRVDEQAQFVSDRRFPVDIRDLSLHHLNRMMAVNGSMTVYLGFAGIVAKLTGSVSTQIRPMVDQLSSIPEMPEVDAPYSVNDFLLLHRRNLNSVAARLELLVKQDSPTAADLESRIGTLITNARASGSGDDTYQQLAAWGQMSAYSWEQFINLWPNPTGRRLASDERYRTFILSVATSLAADKAFPRAPLGADAYRVIHDLRQSDKMEIDADITTLFSGTSQFPVETVLECYAVGRQAYDMTAGLGTHWVFSTLVSIESETRLAKEIIELTELGQAWYMAIEHQAPHEAERFERKRQAVAELSR